MPNPFLTTDAVAPNPFLKQPDAQPDAPEAGLPRAPSPALKDWGNVAGNTGPGILMRAATDFPAKYAQGLASAVNTMTGIPERLGSHTPDQIAQKHAEAAAQAQTAQQAEQSLVQPGAGDLGGQAGMPASGAAPTGQALYSPTPLAPQTNPFLKPEGQPVGYLSPGVLQAGAHATGQQANALAEDKASSGASLMRDAAFAGLNVALPLASTAVQAGIPAALDVLSGPDKPDMVKDPLNPFKMIANPTKEKPVESVTPTGPIDAALRTAFSPEMMKGYLQAAVLGAGVGKEHLAMKPAENMMPGAKPIADVLGQRAVEKSIARNMDPGQTVTDIPEPVKPEARPVMSQPTGSPVKDLLKTLFKKSETGTKLVEGFTPKQDLMQQKLGSELNDPAAAKKITNLLDTFKETQNYAKANAEAVAQDLVKTLSPAERMRVGQMLEGIPKAVLPDNQKTEPIVTTNQLQERYARYYDAAKTAGAAGTADPKLLDAYAKASAWSRVAEDFNRMDPKDLFNYTNTNDEQASLNWRQQFLEKQPENFAAIGNRAGSLSGPERLRQTKEGLKQINALVKNQTEPGQLEKVQRYADAKAKLEGELPPKPDLVGQPSQIQQGLEGQKLSDIRKVLTEGGLTRRTLRQDAIARMQADVPPTPELVKPTAAEVAPFKPGKQYSGPIQVVGPGETAPPAVAGERGKTIYSDNGFGSNEPRPAVLPQPDSGVDDPPKGKLVGQGPIEKLDPITRDTLKSKANDVKNALQALQATKRDIQKAARINYLEKQISSNKLLSESDYQDVLKAKSTYEDRLARGEDVAKHYTALVNELQRNYSGDKGYMKHIQADKLVESVQGAKTAIEAAFRNGTENPRLRSEGFQKRQLDRQNGDFVQSPTIPLQTSIRQSFSAGGFKRMAEGLAKTPGVLALPDGPAAQALMDKGWRRLPKADVYGELGGKLVPPSLGDALQEVTKLAQPNEYEKNLFAAGDWMAKNKAAGTIASNVSLAGRMMYSAFMDAGVPLHRIPGMILKGVRAANDPIYGNEVRAQNFGTQGSMLGSVDSRKAILAAEPELAPVLEAMNTRDAENQPFMKKITNVIDSAGHVMRVLSKPVLGDTASSVMSNTDMHSMFSNTEAIMRNGLYVELRESGMSPEQARQRVKESLIDYSNKTPVGEASTKYTFGFGNRFINPAIQMLDRSVELATNRNPAVAARFWSVPLAVAGINRAMEAQHKPDEIAKMKALQPGATPAQLEAKYQADQLAQEHQAYPWEKFPNSLFKLHLFKDPNGNWVDLHFKRMVPYEATADIATGIGNIANGEGADQLANRVGGLHMAVGPMVEALANRSTFYKRPITNEHLDKSDPLNIRALAEHFGDAYLPDQLPGGRISNQLARIVRGEGNPDANTMRGNRIDMKELGLTAATGLRENVFDRALREFQLVKQYGDKEMKRAAKMIETDPSISKDEKAAAISRLVKRDTGKLQYYFPKAAE